MDDFQLLGPVACRAAGQPVALGPLKRRTLLAALLVDAGRPVTIEALIDRLWEQAPPPAARNVVYSQIAHLRNLLAPAPPAATWPPPRRPTGEPSPAPSAPAGPTVSPAPWATSATSTTIWATCAVPATATCER